MPRGQPQNLEAGVAYEPAPGDVMDQPMQPQGLITRERMDRKKRTANDRALAHLSKLEAAQARLAYELAARIGKRVAILATEIVSIIEHPGPNDGPRVDLLKKLIDKLMPTMDKTLTPAQMRGGPANAVQINIEGVARGGAAGGQTVEVGGDSE